MKNKKIIALIMALCLAAGLLSAVPAVADEEALASLYKWRNEHPFKDGYVYFVPVDDETNEVTRIATEAEFEESVKSARKWAIGQNDRSWMYGHFDLFDIGPIWACFYNESHMPTDMLSYIRNPFSDI